MINPYLRLFTAFTIFFIIVACLLVPPESLAESQPLNGAAQAPPPYVSAQSAIVIEQVTGKVLYEKNGRRKVYPASTTKIVTALLAIESGDLDRVFPIPGAAEGVERSTKCLYAGE